MTCTDLCQRLGWIVIAHYENGWEQAVRLQKRMKDGTWADFTFEAESLAQSVREQADVAGPPFRDALGELAQALDDLLLATSPLETAAQPPNKSRKR